MPRRKVFATQLGLLPGHDQPLGLTPKGTLVPVREPVSTRRQNPKQARRPVSAAYSFERMKGGTDEDSTN